MKFLLILLIRLYQNTLGLIFRGHCRFHPTCSEYMLQSIRKKGVLRGVKSGALRIMRCHPYSKSFGIDEV